MADNDKVESGIGEIMGRLKSSVAPPVVREQNTATEGRQISTPEAVKKYAPPEVRAEHREKAPNRLQTIGQFVTALTYKEAMAMGKGIQTKLEGNGGAKLTVEELTAAIQEWAWEWETFEEERRPGARD